jgi:hypothetical protein
MTKAEMVDGFDVDADESDIGPRRVIQGGKIKFTNDFVWTDSDEEEVPGELELVVADRARVLQKWGADGAPLESRFLEPDEKWPDVDALNAKTPRSEWREGFGNMVGPWQCSWVIYLLNPLTGDKFTYVTSTVGGHMAVGDLSDKIRVMRRLRGARVYPVVTLSDTHMQTKFGGRQRPDFKVVRWVALEGDTALPAPETPRALPAQEQSAAAVVPSTTAPEPKPKKSAAGKKVDTSGMTVVEEPSTEEVLGDKIRF